MVVRSDVSRACGPDASRPSLARRFGIRFGIAVAFDAVAVRLVHYQAALDTVEREVDVLLWSRLAAVKAQERFATDMLLDPYPRAMGLFLADLPAAPGSMPHVLWIGGPRIAPEQFRWRASGSGTALPWMSSSCSVGSRCRTTSSYQGDRGAGLFSAAVPPVTHFEVVPAAAHGSRFYIVSDGRICDGDGQRASPLVTLGLGKVASAHFSR